MGDTSTERPRPRPFEYVLLVFGLALIHRCAWVMDDAFIYARYAVLMKQGLVYNAGEYVEGFSSPLWMLWIMLWRALGAEFWAIWMGTGWLAFALSWWLLIRLDRLSTPTPVGINFPLSFLALSYPVCAWFSSGMETALLQLCAVGTALFLVAPRARAGQILLGLAPLVRPELAAPFLICAGYECWRSRRPPWLALGLGTNLAWLGFRVIYYADLLPNTFYLKHGNNPRQERFRYVATRQISCER